MAFVNRNTLEVIARSYCIVISSLDAQKTLRGLSPISLFRMCGATRAYFISHSTLTAESATRACNT